jgi:hypothetical protein
MPVRVSPIRCRMSDTAASFKGIEARRTPRRVFNRAIGVLYGGRYSIQQALQLSEGGMLFSSDSQFENGERMVATVLLPGGHGILFQAEVIYRRPGPNGSFQYVLKLGNVSIHQKRMIRNYVSAKTQKEAEAEYDG